MMAPMIWAILVSMSFRDMVFLQQVFQNWKYRKRVSLCRLTRHRNSRNRVTAVQPALGRQRIQARGASCTLNMAGEKRPRIWGALGVNQAMEIGRAHV